MLQAASRQDIEQYTDFAYQLVLDHSKSGYPVFTGTGQNKKDFEAYLWKSFYDETREVLLFIQNGKVEGIIQYFYIEDDLYLQTNGFCINRNIDIALQEFIEYCTLHFNGYRIYFGFPRENSAAVRYLEKSGCILSEAAFHDEYIMADYHFQPEDPNILRVSETNFDAFRQLHALYEEDIYWTSDRLLEKLKDWNLFSYCDGGQVIASIYESKNEIFGVDFRKGCFDREIFKKLVYKVLNTCKKNQAKRITFFNDSDTQEIVMEMGFRCVCDYVLYIYNP